jgi:hypothetical protein
LISSKLIRASLTLFLLVTLAAPADAGWLFHRRKARCQKQPAPTSCQARQATYATPQAAPAYQATQGATGDPGTFLAWLNGVRLANGRGAVGWHAGLANDAAVNSSRGFGHSHMGQARRQNAGVGTLATVQAMWLQSPAHADAILDPTITAVGLANVGGVWTFSAY